MADTDRLKELHNRFQLYYDNVASYQAPGLTPYEISVYLTRAQREAVDSLYASYEKDESTRKALLPLVTTATIAASEGQGLSHIAPESKFFALPSDMLYVVYEALTLEKEHYGTCEAFIVAEVTPVPHDEFHRIYRNPFRFGKRKALRLDAKGGHAEIVAHQWVDGTKYYVRYVRRPNPILLEDFYGETIDGVGVATAPELDIKFDDVIAKAAASLAYEDYKK